MMLPERAGTPCPCIQEYAGPLKSGDGAVLYSGCHPEYPSFSELVAGEGQGRPPDRESGCNGVIFREGALVKRLVLTFGLVVSMVVLGRVWNALAADGGRGAGVPNVCPAGTVNGNVNGDSQLDISDPVYLLNFLFSGGPDPCAIAGGGIPTELESLRLVSSNGDPGVLYFGPTDLCSIGVDKSTPSLYLKDVGGVRLLSPSTDFDPILRFGPTDDCSIGIDKATPGLLLRDPAGVRIHIDKASPILRFGPTDDCSIGIDPVAPGLILKDPMGARLLSPNPAFDPILRFGPTDLCSVGIDSKHKGIILRDPGGVRAMSPDPNGPSTIIFGPTDDCTIGIDPKLPGLLIKDPTGPIIMPPNDETDPLLRFMGFGQNPDNICAIGIDRNFPGLLLRDPRGVRLLPPDLPGAPPPSTRLIFGPTDDCSIGIDPEISGLLLRDPRGIRILPAKVEIPMRLLFGPTDDCSIGVDPANPGLRFRDPNGFTFDSVVFAQAFVTTSSRKVKEEIKTIEKPLDILKKLRGVSFQWKEALGGKEDVGFIAEEVAEVLPQVVSPAAGGGSQGVNYGHVVAVAVEGIKHQEEKIEALEKENEALRAKLGGLEAKLAALARQVERLAPAEASEE
jgi:hypothetical protein